MPSLLSPHSSIQNKQSIEMRRKKKALRKSRKNAETKTLRRQVGLLSLSWLLHVWCVCNGAFQKKKTKKGERRGQEGA